MRILQQVWGGVILLACALSPFHTYVAAVPAADPPPAYDVAEQSKSSGGPPSGPQAPYVTSVPFAGAPPQYQMQQPVQYVVS